MEAILLRIFVEIDLLIHQGIAEVFKLIFRIAEEPIFTNGAIESLANRVYGILGVFILFKIVISAVQYLVNPDKLMDKEKGMAGLFQRTIISIALLALVPTIFDVAKEVETSVAGVIPVIILGQEVDYSTTDGESVPEKVGSWMSFVTLKAFIAEKEGKNTQNYPMNNFDDFYNNVTHGCGWLFADDNCIFDYNFIFSIAVGVFMLYVLLSMGIDIAIRTIKLGILELLAPIPIASYINNQENFKAWYQNAFKVYADLFIRLIVIYFIVYVMSILGQQMAEELNNEGVAGIAANFIKDPFVKIYIIIGLLMFAKQAPKFICDILGIKSDGFGSIGEMFKPAWSRAGNAASPLMHLAKPIADYRASIQSGESRGRALRRAMTGAAKGVAHAAGGIMAGDDFAKTFNKFDSSLKKTKKSIAEEGNYSGVKNRVSRTLMRLRDKAKNLEANLGFTDEVNEQATNNYDAYVANKRNRMAELSREINSGTLTDSERRLKLNEYNNINDELSNLSTEEGKEQFIQNEKISLAAQNAQRSAYENNNEKIRTSNARLAEIQRMITAGVSNEQRIALENEAIKLNELISACTTENNSIDSDSNADLNMRKDQIASYMKELDDVKKSISDTETLKVRRHASVYTSVDTFFGGSGGRGESYIKFSEMLGKNRSTIYTGESMTKMKQNVDILVDLNGNPIKYTSDFSSNGYEFTYDEIESLVKDVASGKVDINTLQNVYGIKNSGTLDSVFSEIQKKAARDYVDANIAAEDTEVAANVKVRLKPGAKPNSTITEWWYRFEGELLASGLPREEINEYLRQFKKDPGKFIAAASDLKERMATKGSNIIDAEKPGNSGK